MAESRSKSGRKSEREAIWSFSSIVGALSVVVYIVVVTLRVLRAGVEERAFGSTIFFLIIGAAVLYFLAAILTSALIDGVVKLANWIQGRGAGAEEGEGAVESEAAAPPSHREAEGSGP